MQSIFITMIKSSLITLEISKATSEKTLFFMVSGHRNLSSSQFETEQKKSAILTNS